MQLAGNNPPALFFLNRKEANGSSIQSGVGHLELQNNQTKPISRGENTSRESNFGPMCEEAPLWKVVGDFQLECNWHCLTPHPHGPLCTLGHSGHVADIILFKLLH